MFGITLAGLVGYLWKAGIITAAGKFLYNEFVRDSKDTRIGWIRELGKWSWSVVEVRAAKAEKVSGGKDRWSSADKIREFFKVIEEHLKSLGKAKLSEYERKVLDGIAKLMSEADKLGNYKLVK